jgi:hypothetical protein
VVRQHIIGHAVEWALILAPLIAYLLALGFFVNRRRHPLVMSGPMNMLFVLLACSGFFLIGPPSWLVHTFKHEGAGRDGMLLLVPAKYEHLLNDGATRYFIAYGVYVALLAALSSWLLRRQRRFTVVYHIEPTQFSELLARVLDEMALPYTATPGRIALAEGRLVLDLETSYLFNNVCLRWLGDERDLRQAIERRLMTELAREESGPNAAATILSLAAACLIGLVIFPTIVYFIALFQGD